MADGDIGRALIYCSREYPWGKQIAVTFGREIEGEGLLVAPPVIMVPHDRDERVHPMMRLRDDEAQHFMDQLWQCGLRPSEGSGSAGALAATERHLADMRKMMFAQMGIKE